MVFGEWLDESHYRHQVSLLVSHCKYTFLVVLLCSSLSPRNRLSSLPCELPENGKLKSIKTQMSTTTQRHQTHLTLQLFRVCYRSKLVDCSRRTQHAQGGLSIDCSRRAQHRLLKEGSASIAQGGLSMVQPQSLKSSAYSLLIFANTRPLNCAAVS